MLAALLPEKTASSCPQDLPVIFLCYSVTDAAFTSELDDALRTSGRRSWYARRQVRHGATEQEWRPQIFRVLERAQIVILVSSPRSLASLRCIEELGVARTRQIPVVRVVVEDFVGAEPGWPWSGTSAVDFRPTRPLADGLRELQEILDSLWSS